MKLSDKLRKYKKAIIISALSISSFGFYSYTEDYFEISKNLDIFTTLYRDLNLFYVDETKPGELIKKAIDSMLSSLDPYTEFYPESELEDYKMKYISSSYGGVGALVHAKDGNVIISEPYENFPAQKQDLRAGDVVLKIDNITLKGKSVSEISDLLKGQSGTKVNILIKREGVAEPILKTIAREEIKQKNVTYYGMINDTIGLIRLDKFLDGSAREVKEAFVNLKTNNNLKAIVLDLRGNGGGILQESVDIVNLFIPKGQVIVKQKGKMADMTRSYATLNSPVDATIPLAVLVDRGSASASEITSGSIQDLDRGVIIGQRSFGKGLVQQTKPLTYNSQLKLTVAKYFTPSGRCVQKLNYARKDARGAAELTPDSLITEFKTKNKRSVYDGSGVYPDIVTPIKPFSKISMSLISRFLIFDYATLYKSKHETIAPAKQFKLSDNEYREFLAFIDGKDYDYKTRSEKTLEDLKAIAEREKYYSGIKAEFEALQAKMMHDKNSDLIKFKDEIKELLENEIISRYYFQTGRFEASLKYDSEINEAVKVLNDKKLYASILTGEGNFNIIGKPKSKEDLILIPEEELENPDSDLH